MEYTASNPIVAQIIVMLIVTGTLTMIYSAIKKTRVKKTSYRKTIRLSRQQREVIERKRR